MWDSEGKAERVAALALGAKAAGYHGTVSVVPRVWVFSPIGELFLFLAKSASCLWVHQPSDLVLGRCLPELC